MMFFSPRAKRGHTKQQDMLYNSLNFGAPKAEAGHDLMRLSFWTTLLPMLFREEEKCFEGTEKAIYTSWYRLSRERTIMVRIT